MGGQAPSDDSGGAGGRRPIGWVGADPGPTLMRTGGMVKDAGRIVRDTADRTVPCGKPHRRVRAGCGAAGPFCAYRRAQPRPEEEDPVSPALPAHDLARPPAVSPSRAADEGRMP